MRDCVRKISFQFEWAFFLFFQIFKAIYLKFFLAAFSISDYWRLIFLFLQKFDFSDVRHILVVYFTLQKDWLLFWNLFTRSAFDYCSKIWKVLQNLTLMPFSSNIKTNNFCFFFRLNFEINWNLCFYFFFFLNEFMICKKSTNRCYGWV